MVRYAKLKTTPKMLSSVKYKVTRERVAQIRKLKMMVPPPPLTVALVTVAPENTSACDCNENGGGTRSSE